jgi:hypothetical protein
MLLIRHEGLASNSMVCHTQGSPLGGLRSFLSRPVLLPLLRPVTSGFPKAAITSLLSQADAGRFAIGELDALSFEGALNGREVCGDWLATPQLKAVDGADAHLGFLGEVRQRPVEERSGGSALGG